jgi:hypothetical protein
MLTSFWCSFEQKYRSTPAFAHAPQRRVESAPHTQHLCSFCELIAPSPSCLLLAGCLFDEKSRR